MLLLLVELGRVVGLIDDHEGDVDRGNGVFFFGGTSHLFGDDAQQKGSFRRQHLVQLGQALAYRQFPFTTRNDVSLRDYLLHPM